MATIDFGEAISASFERFMAALRTTAPIALIAGLVMGISMAILVTLLLGAVFGATAIGGGIGFGISAILGLVLAIIVSIALGAIVYSVAGGMMIRATAATEGGAEPPSFSEATSSVEVGPLLRTGLLLAALFAAMALVNVVPILGQLAFIALLLYFGVRWSLTLAVVVFENLEGRDALDRSTELVAPVYWTVLGVLFVLGIVGAVASMILGVVTDAILPGSFLETIGSQVVSALVAPLPIAGTWVIYRSLTAPGQGGGDTMPPPGEVPPPSGPGGA